VHGNVERGESLFYDAIQLFFRDVGERDVVSVEEGKTVVVILNLQTGANASGKLIDEAEETGIVAELGPEFLDMYAGFLILRQIQPDMLLKASARRICR
jgi:hypothetical protein